MELDGKVALVTGAGSGIGRATALRLARDGARVVVSDVLEVRAAETVHLITASEGEAIVAQGDVSQGDDVKALVSRAEEHYGGLDVVHNNAGVLTGPRFPDSPPHYWSRAIDINLRGVLYGIHYGVPALKKRGGGVIINTASISGLVPHHIDPVYAATKAAVVNLTRSLVFLRDEAGIRVNAVCPGLVRTELEEHSSETFRPEDRRRFQEGRAAKRGLPALDPAEIAEAVLELIRDDSLTGVAYKRAVGETWEMV
ncbi:SDR family NAD(P)-dependent oxidoreductase [Blastococcus saxobsidens]|uniref:Short-chain dehydrogenase/reductase SDR n=1 Tax=Blastococcus saxobsidens (strain DD2) TaxID=1146883 RepID=H6RSY9_BLASD|nr:SDR family oxidoreductase [Blastococcus saxobsidens]CCG04292.1 Short-chain dehydrogenase/reductase SDR [Blastococcus saxobsidens DD2]